MADTLTLAAPDGETFQAHLARPQGTPRASLLVIHEIWGLTDHIRAVADRFAVEGYLVVAPDILSHGGVAPELGAELFALMNDPDPEVRATAQPRLRDALAVAHAPQYGTWALGALRAAVDVLADDDAVAGRVGAVGFCFGGTYTFALAASDPRIRAAVPFYGAAGDPADIARITSPVLAFYGGQDATLMQALPDVRRHMADAGVDYEAVVYPDAAHAFFNDTGSRYDADAAADAWRRTTAFLAARL